MRIDACSQCGARYDSPIGNCIARFEELLALDHSRQSPWGSRHGQAFAAFTLQHPESQTRDVLERCWDMLFRIYMRREDPAYVIRTLRRANARTPPRPAVTAFPGREAVRGPFQVTIADLGAFEAVDYPAQLDAWCEATLAGYGR